MYLYVGLNNYAYINMRIFCFSEQNWTSVDFELFRSDEFLGFLAVNYVVVLAVN